MYFKKLIGEKCYLSPLDINDVEQYVTWLNDPEVTCNLTLATAVISLGMSGLLLSITYIEQVKQESLLGIKNTGARATAMKHYPCS